MEIRNTYRKRLLGKSMELRPIFDYVSGIEMDKLGALSLLNAIEHTTDQPWDCL